MGRKPKKAKPEDEITRQQLTMARSDVEFLNEFGLDCRTQGGHNMTRTEIVRSLIQAGRKIGLTAEDCRSGQAVVEAMRKRIERRKTRSC